jgi:2-polyprenyl-3-methyl-5-hydroxy-6-metoxy-1,4-benzoquinol methylase
MIPIEQIDWNEVWNRQLAQVSGMHDTKERWDLYAPIFNHFTNSENFSIQLLPYFDITPGDSVLDIGCGTGGLTIPIARKASRVTALDLSPEMLKLLQENAQLSGNQEPCGDLPSLGVCKGS